MSAPKPVHLCLGSARPFILHLVRVMREGCCGLLSPGGWPGQEFWLLRSGLLGLEVGAPLHHGSRGKGLGGHLALGPRPRGSQAAWLMLGEACAHCLSSHSSVFKRRLLVSPAYTCCRRPSLGASQGEDTYAYLEMFREKHREVS